MGHLEHQDKEKIIQLAANLDNDLETKDIGKVIPYFSEDCEIELLGIMLRGLSGVRNWLEWFFDMFERIKFEPIVIMVQDDIFFEEFKITVFSKNNKKISVKMAEVLKYENYKIKSLRLYFDRLELAESVIDGFFTKKIIKAIKKKSLEGLE